MSTPEDTPSETKLQATIYFYPYFNYGLGKSSLLIEERENTDNSHYLCWPTGHSKKYELNNINGGIAFKLPLKGNVSYDTFLEEIKKTDYYMIRDKIERDKNGDEIGRSYSEEEKNRVNQLFSKWTNNCTHAVLQGLSCAGYLNEKRTTNHIWETPFSLARTIATQLLENFLKQAPNLLQPELFKTNTLEKTNFDLLLQPSPITLTSSFFKESVTGKNEFENFDIINAAKLLNLIKLFKQIDRSHGNELEETFKKNINNPVHFACMNLLYYIHIFADLQHFGNKEKNEIFRWNIASSLFSEIKSHIEGTKTLEETKKKCLSIINMGHELYGYGAHPLIIFLNALSLVLTLGILNIINKARTGYWFPLSYNSPGRVLDKIEFQLNEIIKLTKPFTPANKIKTPEQTNNSSEEILSKQHNNLEIFKSACLLDTKQDDQGRPADDAISTNDSTAKWHSCSARQASSSLMSSNITLFKPLRKKETQTPKKRDHMLPGKRKHHRY